MDLGIGQSDLDRLKQPQHRLISWSRSGRKALPLPPIWFQKSVCNANTFAFFRATAKSASLALLVFFLASKISFATARCSFVLSVWHVQFRWSWLYILLGLMLSEPLILQQFSHQGQNQDWIFAERWNSPSIRVLSTLRIPHAVFFWNPPELIRPATIFRFLVIFSWISSCSLTANLAAWGIVRYTLQLSKVFNFESNSILRWALWKE